MRAFLILMVLGLAGCAKQEVPALPCAALQDGCILAKGRIFVQSDKPPTPLKPFEITVTAPSAQTLTVALSMQGMEMGTNRYRLTRHAAGEWRAQVTLPVCVTGRRDWQMWVEMDNERHALTFQTQ